MQESPIVTSPKFARFTWALLIYTVVAVLWGAFVRGSISGDGCGTHWPTCGGSLLPDFSGLHSLSFGHLFDLFFHPTSQYAHGDVQQAILRKAIEFSHRLSTGPITVGAIVLLFWGFRSFPKRHPVRFAVVLAALFIVFEALIGMVLVLKGYVAMDKSMARAYMMPLHLTNTFILLMALSLAAWFAGGGAPITWRNQGPIAFIVLAAGASFLYLAITGSLSALGDQIYPVKDHLAVIRDASLDNVPFLVQHRPRHPMAAAVCGLLLCLFAGLLAHLRPSPETRRFSYLFWFGMSGQLALGLLNIVLWVPVWVQMSHLLLADLLWVAFVLLCASALAVGVPHVEMLHIPEAVLAGEQKAKIKDYVALTKPRVISLLLFTTLMAMFVAAKGWPGHSFLHGLWLLIATGTGLYAAAGSSNAINMVCERDLDVRMERTASRPTVTEVIHPRKALWFAFGLEAFSFGLLWITSNLLAAALALAGLVVYVIVYTLLLKRRTWSNIVIGGAAGAFPPLVGWAAASNDLSPLAWLLFALIFVWTPVHFWALAILIKDDYAKAGVPMLPVVKGDRYTVIQIGWYAVVTAAVSLAPVLFGAGWIYVVAALALNALLLRGCARLLQTIDRPRASSLFHYSMLYLALLFLALAVDSSVGPRILS